MQQTIILYALFNNGFVFVKFKWQSVAVIFTRVYYHARNNWYGIWIFNVISEFF